MSKIVRVLLGENGRVSKIFRDRTWREYPAEVIREMPKADAVGDIRDQVFERNRNPLTGQIECGRCGRTITKHTGQMHETQLKSLRGEVSLSNCEALCGSCHQTGTDAAHKDRRWQTAKIKDTHD